MIDYDEELQKDEDDVVLLHSSTSNTVAPRDDMLETVLSVSHLTYFEFKLKALNKLENK